MRPHLLKIKNFGPFRETEVDFDAIGNHVFLITGETGSGKTSILDAMVYALFGTASGSGRSDLKSEEYHSDLAKHDGVREPMQVAFSFSENGTKYTVVRFLNWGKKGDAKTVTRSSTLLENDATIVNGRNSESGDEVTKKIKEILGLDADQFRQIIVLAQGEFKKFLEASSKDRAEILGKLYDNSRQIDLCERLKAAKDFLNKKSKKIVSDEELYLNGFTYPEETKEEEKPSYSSENLLSVLQNFIDILTKKQDTLLLEKNDLEENRQKIKEKIVKGRQENELLKQYENAKIEVMKLHESKPLMDQKTALLADAKNAQKVMPYETALLRVQKVLKQSELDVDTHTKKKETLDREAKAHEEVLETVKKEGETRIGSFTEEKTKLETKLPLYKTLTQEQYNLYNAHNRCEALLKIKKTTEEQRDAEKNSLTEINELLGKLDDASQAQINEAVNEEKEIRRKGMLLYNLREAVLRTEKRKKEYNALCEEYKKAQKLSLVCEKDHVYLKERFLSGQAGLLAEELRVRLESEDEVVCMVCGTKHTRKDLDHFAKKAEDIPTADDVSAAEKKLTDALKLESDAKSAMEKREAELNNEISGICEKGNDLFGISDYQVLNDIPMLDKKEAELLEDLKNTEEKEKLAKDRLEDKKNAREKKTALEEKIKKLEEKLLKDTESHHNAQTNMATAKATVDGLLEQLAGFPEDEVSAKKILEDLSGNIEKEKERIHKEETKQKTLDQNLATVSGELEKLVEANKKRVEETKNAKDTFVQKIGEAGFLDEASYIRALSPEGVVLSEEALGIWVRKTEALVNEYNEKCIQMTAKCDQLQKSTKDMVSVNLNELIVQTSVLEMKIKKIDENEHVIANAVSTDYDILKKLDTLLKEKEKTENLLEVIDPLASTANSTKKSFSRYVLFDFFQSIVEQANEHFSMMMEGQAYLSAVDEGAGNTSVDLGLKILDAMGNERNTASLSGGQSFEASLALALGLSEVVQMQSTSRIHIDSMFIDEGFGSLDSKRLDKAIKILEGIADEKRQIGIISHVAKLEGIPKKLRVTTDHINGSKVTVDVDERGKN